MQRPPSKSRIAESPLARLGPGIISGTSDNDPTTVATLGVVGSTTTYALSWLVLLVIPMLIVVGAISAAVGTVTKKGLEELVRSHYGRGWAVAVLGSVLIVNVLTLAADLEGGAAALGLLTGVPYQWFVLPFAVAAALMLVFGSYSAIERILKFTALIFLCYIAAAVLAKPDWALVLRESFVPHLCLSPACVSGAVAILGTTLTAYAFVWETIALSQERPPIRRLGLVQAEAGIGMTVAGVTFWFILVATGATLGAHHHVVATAQQAAEALAPAAGRYATWVFALALLSSAVIAVPVLAGTSAYVFAEMFGWRASLDAKFYRAKRFYVTLISSLALSTAIAYAGISPIKILFFAGLVAAFATPFALTFMMLVARNRTIMKRRCIGRALTVSGWAVNGIVTVACAIFLYQTL